LTPISVAGLVIMTVSICQHPQAPLQDHSRIAVSTLVKSIAGVLE